MKITDVTTFTVGNPWKNWLFVRVDTDQGISGVGEGSLNAFAKTVETAVHELRDAFVGLDPSHVETLHQRMSHAPYTDGGQIHQAAVAAVEVACWDIRGKALGLAIDIVAAVRDAAGPEVELMIEAHSRFDVATAIRVAERLAPYRPTWFEEPVAHGHIPAVVEVARRSPGPSGHRRELSLAEPVCLAARPRCGVDSATRAAAPGRIVAHPPGGGHGRCALCRSGAPQRPRSGVRGNLTH